VGAAPQVRRGRGAGSRRPGFSLTDASRVEQEGSATLGGATGIYRDPKDEAILEYPKQTEAEHRHRRLRRAVAPSYGGLRILTARDYVEAR
jgi:hypothetical protein